ncbi:hypothetical protein EHI8A_014620 [Entamoeba histolytica HM-1:IMSS-B]|uniref:Uncharacterized protein n=6 Tax=Entamoeba histolytica TaxID=5759 RepID=C4M497_ENTH1|nr:hypothetical protein EHI_098000 [Entamoeba histolytica HM-1:IMSS]EMH77008.1 hypothetical protein EHI8A_014620 [Entamoeba histolytica HM-1:IMSS-B]ENY62948.1 hypothetical protein EHI7A_013490 [Entamoeba histolytica HM-1:IMSS-A]BAN39402.1 hypothetical protein [Entamoeba histolytica]EAL45671.2 hypothetical protein EHI_098000 [Entamoeba histolytica HM-1:IMSS]GAT96182.1 hypothetical protein CL6EHI_098000 [Entamoeba histolytica]|eukprot:XP_651057.2 hypothetical protein EHI_098000 [Entamoeba histolytica HM-1:IMSS]
MIVILFIYVLYVFGGSLDKTCACKCDGDSTTSNYQINIMTIDAECPGTATGEILVSQLNEGSFDATISYNLKTVPGGANVTSSSSAFQVKEGTYSLTITYTFETRDFETGTASYKSCSCSFDGLTITAKYETISDITHEVTPNQHCAGSYGTIQCGAKVSSGNVSYRLSGTESRDFNQDGLFSNLPVGRYRCLVSSTHCVSQSEEFSLEYSKKCSSENIWLDRQIYGEGQGLFIAGLVLIVLGIVLNFCICVCCCKLIVHDRKSEKFTKKQFENKTKKSKKQKKEEDELKELK